MNQFKKAKQLRSESGQSTESITDLTTAGVTQKTENVIAAVQEEKAAKQDIEKKSTSEGTPVQYTEPSIKNEQPVSENVQAATPDENDIPPITLETKFSQNTVDINISTETATNEQKNSTQLPVGTADNTLISAEPSIIEPAQKIIYDQPVAQPTINPVPVPSYENVLPGSTIPLTQETIGNNQSPVVMTAQQNNIPVIQEPMPPSYTAPVIYEPGNPQSVVMQPTHEPQPAQKLAAAPQTRGRKKAAPNIFAPKGEAKSMRKSLVLKPTSVQIAEDYCKLNGGSFNELIQTLLDNFIDEYGL